MKVVWTWNNNSKELHFNVTEPVKVVVIQPRAHSIPSGPTLILPTDLPAMHNVRNGYKRETVGRSLRSSWGMQVWVPSSSCYVAMYPIVPHLGTRT